MSECEGCVKFPAADSSSGFFVSIVTRPIDIDKISQEFLLIMKERGKTEDKEILYKETFRVFRFNILGQTVITVGNFSSKDDDGCIPADEFKFVLQNLVGKIQLSEIDEMINTVDRNQDGKISYSEFRVHGIFFFFYTQASFVG